jgi:cobalt-zinc-cadmium efflux system membrane fusion protein
MKHMKSLYKFLQISLIAIASSFILSCGNAPVESSEEHHEEESIVELSLEQVKTAGIELGHLEQKQISGTIKVNGLLDVPPQQLVSVSAPLGGFLKSTVLLQGSHVTKGQVIAVIENPEYIQLQQDYLEAKNQFEFAQADYERQQELAKENVNAQKTLQQAKTNYQSWLAKKNGLLARLKLIHVNIATLEEGIISSIATIYSPINGFVTEVNVNIGKFVNPTDVLFEIVDTEHLHAELIIFEKDVPKIKIGQKVRFTLANETKERMATVYLIGREISADRTIRIHCHIDKEDKDLLPGMYLKALVETGGALVPALPDEAIIDFEGKKYVFVKSEGVDHHEKDSSAETPAKADVVEGTSFMMQEITIGPSELGYTEIVIPEGWSNENEVVIKGAYAILSKMKNSEEGGHAH